MMLPIKRLNFLNSSEYSATLTETSESERVQSFKKALGVSGILQILRIAPDHHL